MTYFQLLYVYMDKYLLDLSNVFIHLGCIKNYTKEMVHLFIKSHVCFPSLYLYCHHFILNIYKLLYNVP